MKRPIVLCLAAVIAWVLIVGGCAQKGDGLSLVSGQWKSAKDGSTVIIDLEKNPKVIAYQQKTFVVNVKKIDGDRISLEVDQEGGQKVTWELVKAWDDNGSAFELDLIRDNTKERLRHS
jgi:hypothetical protein